MYAMSCVLDKENVKISLLV